MLEKKLLDKVEEKEPVFPKNTFEISEVYNPELRSTERFQTMPEPWPVKIFKPDRPMLISTMDEAIGWTPLVRLNRIPQNAGVEAEIRKFSVYFRSKFYRILVVKCEFLNAGGSVGFLRKFVDLSNIFR